VVYAIQVESNGKVNHLKARLVAREYPQIYSLDYGDSWSPVTKITIV